MARKKSTKREALQNVPQNIEELAKAIARIGSLKREISVAEAHANEEIAQIEESTQEVISPLAAEIEEIMDRIYTFAEGNRSALTKEGRTKTIMLATGKISWRTTPPKVSIKKVETVLKLLKKLGLERFIRTTETPNKEAMLSEPDVARSVQGISITQSEEFVVVPSEIPFGEVVKKIRAKSKK